MPFVVKWLIKEGGSICLLSTGAIQVRFEGGTIFNLESPFDDVTFLDKYQIVSSMTLAKAVSSGRDDIHRRLSFITNNITEIVTRLSRNVRNQFNILAELFFFIIISLLTSFQFRWLLTGNHYLDTTVSTAISGVWTTRSYNRFIFLRFQNIQKHESSEIHRINVDRYLTKQKVTREREATREKEVEKIIKKAENVICVLNGDDDQEARDSMYKSHEANYSNSAVMDGRRMSNKRISSYLDSAPSFKITYDTVPTQEQWQASLYNNAPVVYDPNGNVPPPPPVGSMRVDSVSPSIPPPPPVGSGPLVYDPLTGNIPPPPPSVGSEETPSTDTSTAPPKETIKYNFDYESKLTEEDLVGFGSCYNLQFGSWKTVSVTELTEKDLEKREEQYEKAIMKSSKEPVKKGVKPKKEQKKEDSEDEDEDEKDAFDMFNPFGGKYKLD